MTEMARCAVRRLENLAPGLPAGRDSLQPWWERCERDWILQAVRSGGLGCWEHAPELVCRVARACHDFRSHVPGEAMERVLIHAYDHARELLGRPGLGGYGGWLRELLALAGNDHLWLRPVETWRPEGREPGRMLSALVRHLFAFYEVPEFMESAFTSGSTLQVLWFRHVGMGQNMRTAPGLSIPLTKRMAHHLAYVPRGLSLIEGLRWAQVTGMGGRPSVGAAVARSWLGREQLPPREEEWWLGALRWMAQRSHLEAADAGPLVDYLRSRRYGPGEGILVEDPAFSLKGRSLTAVLRLVDRWHGILNRRRAAGSVRFRPAGIGPSRWQTDESVSPAWRFEEILDLEALHEEGEAMYHCVVSYMALVQSGVASIWSARQEQEDGPERVLTIEVRNATRSVVQVRGRRNRYPTKEERNVLKLWAEANGLAVRIE